MTARPKLRPVRRVQALTSAAKDLHYEWDMARIAAVLLSKASGARNQELINVALECFLLHARSIRDFFAVGGTADDVLARDFLGRPIRVAMPLLRSGAVRRRLNRRIAHLSFSRARLGRDWKVRMLLEEIDGAMLQFVRRLRLRHPQLAAAVFAGI